MAKPSRKSKPSTLLENVIYGVSASFKKGSYPQSYQRAVDAARKSKRKEEAVQNEAIAAKARKKKESSGGLGVKRKETSFDPANW